MHAGPDFAPRSRAGLELRADTLTWHHALFALTRGDRTVYVLRAHAEAGPFLARFDAGELDAELHTLLDTPPRARLDRRTARRHAPLLSTGTLVGVEHEYSLFDLDDRQVDFGGLIHTVGVDGVRADPSDPNAYRCPWGGVLTRDGKEAEIAIPPVPVANGFVDAATRLGYDGTAALDALVPGLRREGFSTHLSVSLRVRDDRRFARAYAATFAPALMLVMDRCTSPGMLVRPRPGRIELCGEFVTGAAARAAIAFAVGSVRALAAMDRAPRRDLAVRTRIVPAIERFGWYVDRTAFGGDLYSAGRDASLTPVRRGATRSAQEHLDRSWTLARVALEGITTIDDLAAADAVVAGRTPLPCEIASGSVAVGLG